MYLSGLSSNPAARPPHLPFKLCLLLYKLLVVPGLRILDVVAARIGDGDSTGDIEGEPRKLLLFWNIWLPCCVTRSGRWAAARLSARAL